MTESKSDLVRIGGLWRNSNARGTYLSGKLGQARLLVFENDRNAPGGEWA